MRRIITYGSQNQWGGGAGQGHRTAAQGKGVSLRTSAGERAGQQAPLTDWGGRDFLQA